ncbi:MAG: cytochrome c biogenesis protein CcsA [Bacteroidales bacterium]|nr:cytochrome c biogenesis protein CcsA [Bacteroidales bacterium]
MKKIYNFFLSMTSMGVLLLIFAASIAVATFIENDFGTTAAWALVYDATWFNLLLALLAINLIANIFREKMYRKGRFGMLLFHIAFLIILLGSAITRFISYEGMMHLRNGETSNIILSDRTYVGISATEGQQTVTSEKAVLLSELTPTDYHAKIHVGDKNLTFKAVDFIPNALKKVSESATGDPLIILSAMGNGTRQTLQLSEGQTSSLGIFQIKFGGDIDKNMVNIFLKDGQLQIIAPDTIKYVSMSNGKSDVILPFQTASFTQGALYTIEGINLVLGNFLPHAKITYVASGQRNSNQMDVLMVKIESGSETKEVALQGGDNYVGANNSFDINGVHLNMSYGAKSIQLPFSLKLDQFQLDRYPGSMSPSSYASQVTVIDPKNHKEMPFRIYMNHVLNYDGYRFFQSSYDMDEKGSILSVNHDYWGTFFTYLGYFLMALGMVLSLMNRNSRFAVLGRFLKKASKTRNTALILMIFLLAGATPAFAQHGHLSVTQIPTVSKTEAAQFGRLVTQSQDGRMKPMNTLSSELLRKIAWKSSFDGLNSDQVLLGMMSNALYWQLVPIIKVSDKDLKKKIGIKGNYASYLDFIDVKTGDYKLQADVQKISAEAPSSRNQTDKDILKVDERMNICYMIYHGDFLKVIPNTQNPDNKWYTANTKLDAGVSSADSMMLVGVIPQYLKAVSSGNEVLAAGLVKQISNFQKQYGGSILPSEQKISAEILYNKWMIFDRLSMIYGTIGFIMIILLFIDLLRSSRAIKLVLKVFLWIIAISFIVQTFGLGLRWYISGHAPWSDGYESMIYIAWVTMLAGLIFSRRSMMSVAATTILGSIILMVAHLSWMDPEITNLVPVLKSYWLTIHVSVITASYGFLALSALLGFFNLILSILKSPKNRETIVERIRELTAINERSLTIGLYMLTMGTFLGGIWANESWGRYWGWDPKETWALVSVLVYSFIAHMHRLPGMKSQFSFNLASLLGYSSILMTFFGVNYYLSGLHSYAKGDPIPVPNFVYYTIAVIVIVAIWAWWNERRFKEKPIIE